MVTQIILIALLLTLTQGYEHQESLKTFLRQSNRDIVKSDVMEKLIIGDLGNYLSVEQLDDLM